jgi:hypothetical protein
MTAAAQDGPQGGRDGKRIVKLSEGVLAAIAITLLS